MLVFDKHFKYHLSRWRACLQREGSVVLAHCTQVTIYCFPRGSGSVASKQSATHDPTEGNARGAETPSLGD